MVDVVEISTLKTENTILNDIDKKITLKFFKEKKTSRTYIEGLEDFINQKEIIKLVTSLKKKLGTGMLEKDIDNKKVYGFQGDHRDRIRNILITEIKIAGDRIKS